MAANVLNSKSANEMSIFVVRAFVRLRDALTSNREIASKVKELEVRLDTHDSTIQDIIEAHHIVSQYKSLRIGLADAMTVHLANRFGCRDVLTLDERHFRAMSPRGRRGFRILPADSSPSAERMKRAARSRRR